MELFKQMQCKSNLNFQLSFTNLRTYVSRSEKKFSIKAFRIQVVKSFAFTIINKNVKANTFEMLGYGVFYETNRLF